MTLDTRLEDLRNYLQRHQRVVNHFGLDIERPLASIEAGFPENAISLVGKSLERLLKIIWQHLEIMGDPTVKGLNDLIRPVRDHVSSPSVLQAFKDIQQLRNRAAHDGYELSEHDAFVAVERFTIVLDWAADAVAKLMEGHEIDILPQLQKRLDFILGLYGALGMHLSARFDLSESTVYLALEERAGVKVRYVELMIGASWDELVQVFDKTQGQVLATQYPSTTRFVLTESKVGDAETLDWLNPAPRILGYRAFLDTLVDSSRLREIVEEKSAAGEMLPVEGQVLAIDRRNLTYVASSLWDVEAAVSGGRGLNGNLAVVGGAGTGKSTLLRAWASQDPGESYRFYIDLRDRLEGEAFEDLVTRQIGQAFRVKTRLVWPLFQYLIRSGTCVCYVDSLDEGLREVSLVGVVDLFSEVAELISEKSQTIVSSRNSFLLESPYVRQLFHPSTLVSERVAHQVTAQGVDVLGLPDFGVVRLAGVRGRPGVGGLQASLEASLGIETATLEVASMAALRLGAQRAQVSVESVVEDVGEACFRGISFQEAVNRGEGEGEGAGKALAGACEMLGLSVHKHAVFRELLGALYFVQNRTSERLAGFRVTDLTRSFVFAASQPAAPLGSAATVERGCYLIGPPGEVRTAFVESPFTLSRYVVSAGEYKEFLHETRSGVTAPLHPSCPDPKALQPMWQRITRAGLFQDPALDGLPATCISWFGAWSYARWVGGRLPTSIEWEAAARGWDGRLFPWGDDYAIDRAVCADQIAGRLLESWDDWREAMVRGDVWPLGAVGVADALNVSPHGIVGASGNVWEWTASCLPDEPAAVIAGGSYDNQLRGVQASSRSVRRLGGRGNNVGFRVILDG